VVGHKHHGGLCGPLAHTAQLASLQIPSNAGLQPHSLVVELVLCKGNHPWFMIAYNVQPCVGASQPSLHNSRSAAARATVEFAPGVPQKSDLFVGAFWSQGQLRRGQNSNLRYEANYVFVLYKVSNLRSILKKNTLRFGAT